MTDPRRKAHWKYNKADGARIDDLSDQVDDARHRADAATDDRSCGRHLRSAGRLDGTRLAQRIYPLRIGLWGASIVVVILPWSILVRAGHGGIELTVGGVVLVGVLASDGRGADRTAPVVLDLSHHRKCELSDLVESYLKCSEGGSLRADQADRRSVGSG